jgi:hypothetical protein
MSFLVGQGKCRIWRARARCSWAGAGLRVKPATRLWSSGICKLPIEFGQEVCTVGYVLGGITGTCHIGTGCMAAVTTP